MTRRRPLLAALATSALTLTILAGCSGPGSDATTARDGTAQGTGDLDMVKEKIANMDEDTYDDPPPSPVLLESAVRAYTAAFLGGADDAAYELLSDRCHGETASAEFEAMVDQASSQYGDVTITSYEASVNGSTATVTYRLTEPYLNQTNERWVFESGGWLNDDC